MIWHLKDVSLRGPPGERLSSVTLDVGEETTAVLGCSGAGKTSLLNLLVGFERPDEGEIEFHAAPSGERAATEITEFTEPLASALSVASVARRPTGSPLPLFWVPQEGGLWPHLTARQHLETVSPPGEEWRVPGLMAAFDIGERAASYPDSLSAGEQSRLAVARALASGARVLVMDEPLSNVDEARAREFWDAIREHVSESRASLVFATHSPKAVLREAERAVCLKEGRVIYSGEVDGLYHRPATPELMDCLGEGNWLGRAESRLWLGVEACRARCYRPEQIAVEKAAAVEKRDRGPVTVRRSVFQGAVAEVELEHGETRQVKRFYHRPRSNSLRPGDRVLLRALVALLVIPVISCGSSDEPELPLRHVRTWMLPPDGARIPAPRAVAFGPGDRLAVLDTAGRVLIYDCGRRPVGQWRMPESEAGSPEAVLFLLDGRIAVADTHYHRVLIFDDEGHVRREIGREGRGPGEFIYPVAMAQDGEGNVYVCEYGSNDRVQKFSREGELLASFGSFGTGPAQFQRPSGIVWRKGKLYVADAVNNRVLVFSDDGRLLGRLGRLGGEVASICLRFPYDLASGPDGSLYVIEYGACRVTKLSPDGKLLGRYGRTGSGPGEFATPWGIATDSRGRIVVADTGNRRIVELEP